MRATLPHFFGFAAADGVGGSRKAELDEVAIVGADAVDVRLGDGARERRVGNVVAEKPSASTARHVASSAERSGSRASRARMAAMSCWIGFFEATSRRSLMASSHVSISGNTEPSVAYTARSVRLSMSYA